MPATLTDTIGRISGPGHEWAEVSLAWAGADVVYVASGKRVGLEQPAVVEGAWSLAVPLASEVLPAGVVLEVTTQVGGQLVVEHVALPTVEGSTRTVASLLTDPPATVASSALGAHAAAPDPHAGYRLESTPIAAADLSFDVATQAELDALGATKAPALEAVNVVAASGAAQVIPDPVTAQSVSRVTLNADCTFTFPAAAAGKSFTLALAQDAVGSRSVTWPATAKWPGGAAPTLSTGPAKVDYLSFLCADGATWAGFVAGLDLR